jgi:hypothetical protein
MSTVLLLHFDGLNGSTTFTDSSGNGHVPTAGGTAQLDTSFSYFGNASLLLDGSGFITLDGSADFAFGTGDFTVDFRFRNSVEAVLQAIIDFGAASGNFKIYLPTDDSVVFSSPAGLLNSASGGAPVGSNKHIAITRAGGVTRLFLNGVQQGGTLVDTTNYTNIVNLPRIGSLADGTQPLTGHVDELRIVKGFAAWTSNFTPPAGPYSPDVKQTRAPFYHVRRELDYSTSLRMWFGRIPPALAAAVPFNQTDWQLPRAPVLPQRSWTWNYNLNLIAQDKLPAGEQVYAAPVGPIQPLRVWQWSYNLNLIGKDALPVGEQRFDLTPFGYIHPTQLRTWIDTVHLALSTPPAPRPFRQIDWPLPRAPRQPAFSYTWNYNLNLISKDLLPTGEQVFELTPRDYSRPHIYLWTWRYNLNLIGQDKLPVGEQRIELTPAGHIYPTQLRTWIDYRIRALDFVAGAQPDGKRWFDLAPRDDRPYQLRSWTWTYNLNLIGKDRLPAGEQLSVLPLRITPAAIQTWISQVSLALRRPVAPFNQTDWQNPRWPQQAITNRTWTASYNLNLIGKDRLPTGEAVFDLAPRGHIYPTDLRTFVKQLNLALIVPPAPLPKNQKDWPLPGQPHYPIGIRSFINFSNIDFIVPAPPEVPPRDPTHVRTRSGFETDSRGPASLDRRGSDRFYRGRNQS